MNKNLIHKNWRTWAPPLIIAAIAFVTYSRALTLGYIWDDHALIENASKVQSTAELVQIFAGDFFQKPNEESPQIASEYFRPITSLTYWLETRLGSNSAIFGHLINLLIHCSSILLFFALALKLGFSSRQSFYASLLFALHPVLSESVYWVSARGDLLSTLFVLSACLFFLSHRQSVANISLGSLMTLMALLSKETAIGALPLVILLPLHKAHFNKLFTWIHAMSIAGIAVIYFAWRSATGVFMPGKAGLTEGTNILIDFASVASTFLKWFISPFFLSAAHDFDPLSGPKLILATILVVSLFAAGLYFWTQKQRLPLISILSFYAYTLLIALAVRNIGVVAERYAYLATVPLLLFGANVILLVVQKADLTLFNHKWVPTAILFLFAAIYIPTIALRAGAWKSEQALFTAALQTTNSSESMRLLASIAAHQERNFAKAATLYNQRVQKRPKDAASWNNLAACFIELKQYKRAFKSAKNARKLEPWRHNAWLNEATALTMIGRPKEALILLDKYENFYALKNNAPLARRLPINQRYREVKSLAISRLKHDI